ncbi:hypothetical protein SAMN04489752_2647 [Brevibacterium siliguriense]|uniref:Lipoprotein n=1 Tax=Brevibacterium siliguriense TaxID=1136497 RepID=A0A1H1VGS5_9MICO|nr:hypothetical protein [Brevibacterium siliguriense]SDS83780.1 hypothetical protein SAMN04489752_2647 [Brevibacterium siliguriense]
MNRSLAAAALVLGVTLSGCSAFRVSSSDEAGSKPASVGVGDGQSPSPKATGPTIPNGMSETTVDLGGQCPVEVSLVLGADWADGSGYDGYRLYQAESGAIITFNCFDDDESSPQGVVEKARERMFSTSGSSLGGESTGSLSGGEYWVFHGTLAPDDMRAVDKEDSVIFGAVGGVSVDGRQFKVSVDMLAQADDTEAQDQFRQMLPTVRFGDQVLKAPDLR